MRALNFFTGRRRRFRKAEKLRIVSFTGVSTKEELHDRLREELAVDGYVGSNLDALYDVLTSVSVRMRVILRGLEALPEPLAGCADGVRTVFRDAAAENPLLTFSEEAEEENRS